YGPCRIAARSRRHTSKNSVFPTFHRRSSGFVPSLGELFRLFPIFPAKLSPYGCAALKSRGYRNKASATHWASQSNEWGRKFAKCGGTAVGIRSLTLTRSGGWSPI